MKLYYYNSKTLQFKRLKYFTSVLKMSFIVISAFVLLGINTQKFNPKIEYEKVLMVQEKDTFSAKKLQKKILQYNFRFPHIVYAQSLLETSHFKSGIFMENHNLFGMKQAVVRLNTAKGTNRNHAYYDSWEESFLDYALWYSTYASRCRTEAQMFQVLENYAEDTLYTIKLKDLINKYKLRELFVTPSNV